MIRITTVAFVALLALSLTGCSSLSVYQDWDEQVDFQKFRTFKVMDSQTTGNQLVDKRIQEATRISLTNRGLVENEAAPDLLVALHVNVKDKVNVQTYNYGYPYYGYPYWHGGQDISVSQYQEGTLVIDFVDSEDNELVWRGWGVKVLDGGSSDPDSIQKIIDKIIDQFPPK